MDLFAQSANVGPQYFRVVICSSALLAFLPKPKTCDNEEVAVFEGCVAQVLGSSYNAVA
jgi:hypothetical protein